VAGLAQQKQDPSPAERLGGRRSNAGKGRQTCDQKGATLTGFKPCKPVHGRLHVTDETPA
jgi:hypothetical protein